LALPSNKKQKDLYITEGTELIISLKIKNLNNLNFKGEYYDY